MFGSLTVKVGGEQLDEKMISPESGAGNPDVPDEEKALEVS